jgi:hypothetical protein
MAHAARLGKFVHKLPGRNLQRRQRRVGLDANRMDLRVGARTSVVEQGQVIDLPSLVARRQTLELQFEIKTGRQHGGSLGSALHTVVLSWLGAGIFQDQSNKSEPARQLAGAFL